MRKPYPLLRSVRSALFVLLLLYTLVIAAFTSGLFFYGGWEKACQTLEEGIVLTDRTMTSFFDEVNRIAAHLATNESILSDAMFRFPMDSLKNYQATRRLQNLQLSYSYLDYIALYSQSNDRLLSTVDMGQASSRRIKEEIVQQYGKRPAAGFTYLEINSTEKSLSVSAKPTLSFIAYSNLTKPGNIGAVVLGVNADSLQQLFAQNEYAEYAPVFLLNKDGQMLSGPEGLFPEGTVRTALLEKTAGGEALSGCFSMTVGEEENVVCFSRNASTGTCLIQLIPSRILRERLPQMVAETSVAVGVIFCAGIMISYILSYQLLKPLYRLLSKHDYASSGGKVEPLTEIAFLDREFTRLSKDAEKSEVLMCRTALHDLLLGQRLSDSVTSGILNKFLIFSWYQIIFISFDEEVMGQNITAQEFSVLRYAVCNIAAEILKPERERLDAVFVNSTDVVLILASERRREPAALKAELRNLVNVFLKHYQTELLIAVSSSVKGIYDLNSGYLEAVSLMQQNFLYQKDIVFAETDAQKYTVKPFPIQMEEDAFSAVLANKPEQIEIRVAGFFQYVSDTNYEYALLYISRFVMDFFNYCVKIMPVVDPVPFQTIISQLYKAKSVCRVQGRISLLCKEMAESQSPKEKTYAPIILRALEITGENYWREDFSVNAAADILNITTPYFNRIFKKEYGASYGEYLNSLRIQKAKELLAETELSVAEICIRSGFANASYFYTLFKKLSGLTPAEFRVNWRKSEAARRGGKA